MQFGSIENTNTIDIVKYKTRIVYEFRIRI
jgi:hypothetical protein